MISNIYVVVRCLNIIITSSLSIVLVDPETPTIINGGIMTLSGPSFNTTSSHEKITCVFTDDDGDVTEMFPHTFARPINGIIVNCKAICPMPLFRKLGPHNLIVTLNNTKFEGEFIVGKGGVQLFVSVCIYIYILCASGYMMCCEILYAMLHTL